LYDPLVKLLGGNTARELLLDQAALRPGHRVLDIGCGTGSLAVLIKRKVPNVEVVGLDPTLLVGHIAYYEASVPASLITATGVR
jgi:cyclopropane fatty-acyl-phospholipid synthase-like methyltransferase